MFMAVYPELIWKINGGHDDSESQVDTLVEF
jgi:hypothetical protein